VINAFIEEIIAMIIKTKIILNNIEGYSEE